jgi:hypothetical protein
MKQSIIGGDLNVPHANRKGNVECISGYQSFINRVVLENEYTQIVYGETQGDALLNVYLLQPESVVNSCSVEQGITDHCGLLLLEVEWKKITVNLV